MNVIGRVSGRARWQASRIRSSWAHLDDHALDVSTGGGIALMAVLLVPLAVAMFMGVVM